MLVFEGLIAELPDAKARAKYSAYAKVNQWGRALRQYQINELLAKHFMDIVWRKGYSIDVVTFLDERAVEPLEELLDGWGLPVGNITFSEKSMLARSLNYRLDVVGVFHPNPADVLTFGSKGHLVNPQSPLFF